MLTLTATPIPRTLNMSIAGMRDLSIIATPPARRLSVRTFVMEQQNTVIKEALLRELLRGGQVYYLHNDVKTIEKCAATCDGEPEPHTRIACRTADCTRPTPRTRAAVRPICPRRSRIAPAVRASPSRHPPGTVTPWPRSEQRR